MYKFVKGFKNKTDSSITSSSRVDQGVSSGDDMTTTTANSRSSANVQQQPVVSQVTTASNRPLSASSSFSIDESTGETIASRRKRTAGVDLRPRSVEVRPSMSTLDSASDFNTTVTMSSTRDHLPARSKSSHPSSDTSTSSRPPSIVKIKPSKS